MPAGIAAVRRHVQQPENPPKFTLDPLFGDSLQLEVSASRTTWMAEKRDSRRASIKSALAFHASPRTQRRNRHQPVANSATVRSQAAFVPATWANHPVVRLFSGRRIHKPVLNFNPFIRTNSSVRECRSVLIGRVIEPREQLRSRRGRFAATPL